MNAVGGLFSVKVFWESIVNRFVLPQPLFPTTTTFFWITSTTFFGIPSIQLGYKEGIGNSVASVGPKFLIPPLQKF